MNVRDLLLAGDLLDLGPLEYAVRNLLRAARRWRVAADTIDDVPEGREPTSEQLAELEAALDALWHADLELERVEPEPIARGEAH